MILAWNGSLLNIPIGWVLCDGNNGTPNLQNRFILGAGIRSIGEIGGSETHTLTIDEMPTHSHQQGSEGVHDYFGGGTYVNHWACDQGAFNVYTYQNTSAVGGNQPHNIMNPYYVLAYIMKK